MRAFFVNLAKREGDFVREATKGERMSITRRIAFARIAASTLIGYFSGGFLARASGSVTYTYDALGRVVSATYATGQTITYAYDDAGNRTQMVQGSGGGSGFNQTIPVTGTAPVNLRTLANNAGYNGAQNATIVFQVNSGVTISGAAGGTGGIAIDTGTWPSGYTTILSLHVTNGGAVRGGGGGGGAGGGSSQSGSPGGAGGDALYCRVPMAVTVDPSGYIQAGGGGGGGGGLTNGSSGSNYGGGGGGGGFPNGSGGSGGSGSMIIAGQNGGAGSISGGGPGGTTSSGSGYGGDGGDSGSSGGNGGSSGSNAGGSGGAAGYAIRKNGNSVTVTNNGTITGTIG